MIKWRGMGMTKLYEANNHILIHTETLQPSKHRHMAAHIILSVGGGMDKGHPSAEELQGAVHFFESLLNIS